MPWKSGNSRTSSNPAAASASAERAWPAGHLGAAVADLGVRRAPVTPAQVGGSARGVELPPPALKYRTGRAGDVSGTTRVAAHGQPQEVPEADALPRGGLQPRDRAAGLVSRVADTGRQVGQGRRRKGNCPFNREPHASPVALVHQDGFRGELDRPAPWIAHELEHVPARILLVLDLVVREVREIPLAADPGVRELGRESDPVPSRASAQGNGARAIPGDLLQLGIREKNRFLVGGEGQGCHPRPFGDDGDASSRLGSPQVRNWPACPSEAVADLAEVVQGAHSTMPSWG